MREYIISTTAGVSRVYIADVVLKSLEGIELSYLR